MEATNSAAKWPAFYSEGAPPDDSVPANGIAYRFVRVIPPCREDFQATLEDPRGRTFIGEELVNACGTSFHTNLEASRRTRKRYKGLRNRKIATGELAP